MRVLYRIGFIPVPFRVWNWALHTPLTTWCNLIVDGRKYQ